MCVFQGWCVKSSEPCTLNIHSVPKEVIPGQVNVLGFCSQLFNSIFFEWHFAVISDDIYACIWCGGPAWMCPWNVSMKVHGFIVVGIWVFLVPFLICCLWRLRCFNCYNATKPVFIFIWSGKIVFILFQNCEFHLNPFILCFCTCVFFLVCVFNEL